MNRNDKRLLAVAAAGEAAMGLALIVNPPMVARLLRGAELSLVGTAMSRVADISLLAVGWAGWPGIDASRSITTLLNYSLLVTVYFGLPRFCGQAGGAIPLVRMRVAPGVDGSPWPRMVEPRSPPDAAGLEFV